MLRSIRSLSARKQFLLALLSVRKQFLLALLVLCATLPRLLQKTHTKGFQDHQTFFAKALKTSYRNQTTAPAGQIAPMSQTSQMLNTTPTTTHNNFSSMPIVIISSLRPWYLSQVLHSLKDQNPNTPSWILYSTRYLFLHKHKFNDVGDRFERTQRLAKQHNLSVHIFPELYQGANPPPDATMAYYAKYAWYKMMEYLFHTLNVTQALILEDDAVLARDALLMASAMMLEQNHRSDVHNFVLGGWSGENRINAHPNTFQAARSVNFQAMAYSLNRSIFDEIHSAFNISTFNTSLPEVTDWSEEITRREFLTNYTVLSPSVGRVYHIGVKGMGVDGDGAKDRHVYPRGWEPWASTVEEDHHYRTISDLYLDPVNVTDVFGFFCYPIQADCGFAKRQFPVNQRFGASQVLRDGGVKKSQ